jgi:hypothetical protein
LRDSFLIPVGTSSVLEILVKIALTISTFREFDLTRMVIGLLSSLEVAILIPVSFEKESLELQVAREYAIVPDDLPEIS